MLQPFELFYNKTTMIQSQTVIIALINGMIGGVILVLPLLSLQAGTITTGIVILVSGIFSYYSSMLCLKHLGVHNDLDQALTHHFNQNKAISVFYDLIVFLNLALLLLLYFNLITQQWQGLIDLSSQSTNIYNATLNALALLALVFIMKIYDFGESLLAYGIISIIGYCIFLVWLLASAPSGDNQIQTIGEGGIQMAASMGTAFSIQTFFIPILRKNMNQSGYQFYTFAAYLVGGSIYMYIAYAGSFGILHRTPEDLNPETIEDYFPNGCWQVYSLQILYLIHLYSVFPEFLLIAKKRFFNAFGINPSNQGQIPYKEIIFALNLIVICLLVSLTKIEIEAIIQINGAVIGFFFIYFLPLIMHVKCIYFSSNTKSAEPLIKQKSAQVIEITQIDIRKSEDNYSNQQQSNISQNQQPKQSLNTTLLNYSSQPLKKQIICEATIPQSIIVRVFDWVMLIGMMSVGIFIMYGGVRSVFQ